MNGQKSHLYQLNEKIQGLTRILVVGDLHGDFDSLCSLIDIFHPINDFIIFLGDYADRGTAGVEVLQSVEDLAKNHPQNVLLLKGNHEDFTDSGKPKFFPCHLCEEVEKKKGKWKEYFQTNFKKFLELLYLAAIINHEILFVHGGISSKIKTVNDLRHPSHAIKNDLIWSDPFEGLGEFSNKKRGSGVKFGRDISENFCKVIGVKRIIRAHEPLKALKEPRFEHNGRVITVSSTRAYGGQPFVLSIKISRFSQIKVIELK
jgi:diadenosine tetraphosphatase ApaH/serine/threonine PP2A family protein phosphatase